MSRGFQSESAQSNGFNRNSLRSFFEQAAQDNEWSEEYTKENDTN